MKTLVAIFLLTSFSALSQSNYYVDTLGSDLNSGTTISPYKTIAKALSVVVKGDNIWLRANQNFKVSSTLNISVDSIKIGRYGTGSNPNVTAFETVTGFTNIGGNIWRATQSLKNLNTVLIDGQIRAKGRYPNTGYLSNAVAFPSTSQLVVPHSTTNYTGYDIVIRTARWILDRTRIVSINTGASNDTLNLFPAVTYNTIGNNYFFQNHVNTLDTLGEWGVDSSNNYLYVYSLTSPNVEASKVNNIFEFFHKSNIRFDSLDISGANNYGINYDSASCANISITNCNLKQIGGIGIIGHNNKNTKIYSTTFTDILSNGALFTIDTTLDIQGCSLYNIGNFPGMGINGNGMYIGLYNDGLTPRYALNSLINIGYIGIRFRGVNSRVDSNYIYHYGYVKDDGGGIYTWQPNGQNSYTSGSRVRGNIIIGGIGAPVNNSDLSRYSHAIYLDDYSNGITVEGNTCDSATTQTIFTKGLNSTIKNNTVRTSDGTAFYSDTYFVSTTLGLNVTGNIFYKSIPAVYQVYLFRLTGQRDTTEHIDSNYYLAPESDFNILYDGNTTFSLTAWQAWMKSDLHSTSSFPADYTSTNGILLYNETSANKYFTLPSAYSDPFGAVYASPVIVQPHQSKLLFPITTPTRVGGFIFK